MRLECRRIGNLQWTTRGFLYASREARRRGVKIDSKSGEVVQKWISKNEWLVYSMITGRPVLAGAPIGGNIIGLLDRNE